MDTASHCFHKWRKEGILRDANDALRRRARPQAATRSRASPSSTPSRRRWKKGGRGFDGGKLVKGRKGFVAVDSLGLVPSAWAVPARVGESTGGKDLLRDLAGGPRLRKALVDGGFKGAPLADLGKSLGIEVEAVRTPRERGFEVVPRRWVVERTFA